LSLHDALPILTGTDGIFNTSITMTTTAGTSITHDISNVSRSPAIVSSAMDRSPPPSWNIAPAIQYMIAAMMKAGTDTYDIDRICLNSSTLDNDAVITVVSESGDILSPT